MNELQTVTTALTANDQLLERYINSLDVKPKTKETYKKALRQFFKWQEENQAGQIDRADILSYKAYLMEKYAAATVSAYITAVRGLFAWLEAEKIYPNVTAGIKGAKASRGFKKDTLTPHQAKSVLSHIERDSVEQLRDYAIINLLLRTGLRTIEAQRANIEDIRQQAGQCLLYIQGKGRDSKDAFVILTPATLEPIQQYLIARGRADQSAPLFISHGNRSKGERLTTRSISRIAKEALKAAGIDSDRITAHSLRHTAITFSLLGGATIQEAQQLARHSNINTTLIYAHNIDRINRAPESKLDSYLDSF